MEARTSAQQQHQQQRQQRKNISFALYPWAPSIRTCCFKFFFFTTGIYFHFHLSGLQCSVTGPNHIHCDCSNASTAHRHKNIYKQCINYNLLNLKLDYFCLPLFFFFCCGAVFSFRLSEFTSHFLYTDFVASFCSSVWSIRVCGEWSSVKWVEKSRQQKKTNLIENQQQRQQHEAKVKCLLAFGNAMK